MESKHCLPKIGPVASLLSYCIFASMPKKNASILALAMIALAGVAVVDSATGPEVSLSAFYLIPVTLAAWTNGRTTGLIFAGVSSVAWLVVELNFGRAYRNHFVPYCNALLQLGIAGFSAYLTALVRERQSAVLQESEARKKAEMELHMERALADAIEGEQQRLGRDLHDGLGQHLVSAGFVASMLATKLEEKEIPEAREAHELTELISDAIGQSRRVARGLFPVKLEAEGLTSALHELTENVAARSRIICRFETNCADLATGPEVSANLFRIAQEAVNNALKHGKPSRVLVSLRRGAAAIELSVENDGLAYVAPVQDHSGMGIRIMEHRARLIGGRCSLTPGAAGGARVVCAVPIPPGGRS